MRKLILFTGAGLAAVVLLAGVAVYTGLAAKTTVAEVDGLGRVRDQTEEIRLNMIAMSNAMRGYLLDTKNTDALKEKDAADDGLVAAVDRLKKSTTAPELIELADQIGALDEAELDPMEDKVLEAAPKSAAEATRLYFEQYMPIRERQMAIVEKLDAKAEEMSTAQLAAAQVRTSRLSMIAIGAGVTVVALLAWSVWTTIVVSRKVTGASSTLGETADGVLRTAREVGRASQSLSQGATEQAASIEETSASMEEMASMTRKNAENTRTAAGLMTDVDSRVQVSNRALEDMVTSMQSIQDASQQVARIIKTIDEIAFQTNILALNAAVEAARAGEAGMGFAVVADEVRKLAQRSAQAARDTAGLIDASLAKTQAGTRTVQQVADAIGAITESVSQVKMLVDEVSEASQQQAQGIDQVSHAVSQMEKVTQTTAATAEESAAAGEELTSQAERALQLVSQLQAVVGGSVVEAAPRAAVATPAKTPAHVATAAPGKVVRMPAKTVSPAEAAIPFDDADTGTFGSF
ncbi:MAG: methyl-accepting chemotaxis protein [Vicinamibacterales bacterium]